MKRIYLDAAASTPMYYRVLLKMLIVGWRYYGNPSSVHLEGLQARYQIDKSRHVIASILGCDDDEIFFTSGASESNAWVCKNFYYICTLDSHDSMLLGNQSDVGLKMSYPLIDSITGHINSLNYDKTCHIDLTQAVGKVKIKLHEMLCETASCSAHKFGGPKGIGILYIKKECQRNYQPLIFGHQENGFRGGTENIMGIVGMAEALQITYKKLNKNNKKYKKYENYIYNKLNHKVKIININNNIINITFYNLHSQSAVSIFSQYGIAISAGSACNSNSDEIALSFTYHGYSAQDAQNTIRISLGYITKMKDIKKFCKKCIMIIDKYDNLK